MTSEMQACPSCSKQIPRRYRRCGFCGATLTAATDAPEIRRRATIVTSDLKGSTALGERLDPESLREVLSTYFDEMRAVFESHGGTIEKIIGDAIVAVFGLATSRDDDALRAVEAAAESQRALALLNDRLEERWGVRLVVRTGIASGEVIVGEASAGQHVLTGRTIGLATAMEQNAPPLEVLMAASTYEAVQQAVRVAPIGIVQAKGSDEPLRAYRLLSVAERSDAEQVPTIDAQGTRTCRVCGESNLEAFTSCGTCGAALTREPSVSETRKTVTIVFADPKPMTADGSPPTPEALRDVMSRYFAAMQQALTRHGATVEKFIGDAVMAVFGLPTRHEDDALRAVRAANDMQQALPQLNTAFEEEWGITLQNHIGVNTGEVVAGDASLGQRLVTGDTVNVAARLEQAAGEREILLGALTYRLVREAVTVEEVEPLSLKGKAERVPAYRLVSVSEAGEGIRRRSDAPMIGRESEMEALGEIFRRVVSQRACRMATVVGDAGVGKSRLIAEFTADPASDALVIRGRCLSYGEGITFWPLREAVRDAAGIGNDDPPPVAMDKLRRRAADDAVTDRLASVIGLSQAPFPIPEVYWGARKFLEGLARERPIVFVADDIHWAETIFLELIAYLVEAVQDSPILLLLTSRHELLEAHPGWSTEEDSLRLILRPLTDADSGRVVEALLGGTGIADDVSARIVQAAAGNPLFVEQLLSMLIDTGALRQADGAWTQEGDLTHLDVPPSIQALLAARLDLLQQEERSVIEPASVIGQTFAQGAVEALVPQRVSPQVGEHLSTLTRKELVQPNPVNEAQEIAFRFQHLLVRDAAYDGLLKRARADLHERFVGWAEDFNARHGFDDREFEEIHGYHLEQAYRYLSELGTLDDRARGLGTRASRKLASAGRRAMIRGDGPAAANLLRRATTVLPPDSAERGLLLPRLAEAQLEIGEFDASREALREAQRIAKVLADERLEADTGLVQLLMEIFTADQEDWAEKAADAIDRAIPIFERADDAASLALAYRLRYIFDGRPGRYGKAAASAQQVIAFAREAADRRLETRGITGYAQAALFGPTPVAEALATLSELVQEAAGDRRAEALIRLALAQLHAMQGEFEVARELSATAVQMLADLGPGVVAASTSIDTAPVEILAGDLAAAERALRRDDEDLAAMGEQYVRSTVAGLLARVLILQGRVEEAEEAAERTRALAAEDDVEPQIAWRLARARIVVHRGETDEGLALAAQALALSQTADNPRLRALVLADLAEIQARARRDTEANAAWAEAIALYEQKGDRISADQLRASHAERARS